MDDGRDVGAFNLALQTTGRRSKGAKSKLVKSGFYRRGVAFVGKFAAVSEGFLRVEVLRYFGPRHGFESFAWLDGPKLSLLFIKQPTGIVCFDA